MRRIKLFGTRVIFCAGLALCMDMQVLPSSAAAQRTNQPQTPAPLSLPPSEWARFAAENEIKIIRYNSPYLRYRIRQVDSKGDQTRDIIESKDGTVARLIAHSGKPLTKEQDDAERGRLQGMLNSPQEFAKHIKNEQSGKDAGVDVLQWMPIAMVYSFAPGQPQRPDAPARSDGSQEVVLDFKPNPEWKPPTLKAEALTGLDGRLWIDPETRVVMRMEARIFQGINFGWGMLAHVYPGGTLTVEQSALPAHRFIASHFVEDVTIRAMMLKTLKVHEDMSASSFTPIAGMTYQQAIQTLLDTPLSTTN